MFPRRASLTTAVLCLAGSALAQVPLEGWFIASQPCEAYQSKNSLTNPGDITLADHMAYDMIGINKTGGIGIRFGCRTRR
ncbi:MAG: hypothetical protein ACWA5A_06445 [Marinibacterium sp.]